MPPYVPRKRHSPPASSSKAPAYGSAPNTPRTRKRATLFDTADGDVKARPTTEENKAFLDAEDDGDDSLSEVDSDEFEDAFPVPAPKRRKTGNARNDSSHSQIEHVSDEDDDVDMDWEDAIGGSETHGANHRQMNEPEISGDLELELDSVPTHTLGSLTSVNSGKKGPSKIERQIRTATHQIHVQCLMFHNAIRNAWACDTDVQEVLVDALPPGVISEVERFKADCGSLGVWVGGVGDKNSRQKGKQKADRYSKAHKNQRDWGKTADRQEEGVPNLSHGDPTLRVLKMLASYWRKRFAITAPALRKQGYKDMQRLDQEVKSYKNDVHDPDEHGERISGIEEFRTAARKCQGSRDVGAQLFTALLRGLGIEARLVANLQVVGFGWSKSEEACPKKPPKNSKQSKREHSEVSPTDEAGANGEMVAASTASNGKKARSQGKPASQPHGGGIRSSARKTRAGGGADAPIDLSDDSELSSPPPSESEDDEDDASVIDVTPAQPAKTANRYDRDLPFPTYWTEVLSPISKTWIPVDPIVLSLVAGRSDGLVYFEPRGSKADRAKQVIAYVVAHSSDGSAKDVTVRYLKRHMWPGKTKGVRIPVEKVPIYNRRGKIKHYEEYDWFKTVMSGYTRSSKDRTEADDIEEANELQPVRPVRDSSKAGGEETLQWYKSSAEFVLERHLRREEALLPHAKQIKTFKTGKGDNAKEEPVYRRRDVVACKTIESWHKEGRAVKEGEMPLKWVPMRAVTLMRKREIEEAERESGEKLKQPLYSRAQTDWIIPPPIENGVIPKNAFGNMDVYVPSMVPKGAIHIPLRGTAKLCRRLEIDYAEACTGFEFGNKRAVPILTGVVVAKEYEDAVIDAWEAEEDAKRSKEAMKREKLALGMWKKLLTGLRIVERVRQEYGADAEAHIEEAIHPMASKTVKAKHGQKETDAVQDDFDAMDIDGDTAMEGGFFRDDADEDQSEFQPQFLEEEGGGLILEDDSVASKHAAQSETPNSHVRSPVSLQSLHRTEDSLLLPHAYSLASKNRIGTSESNTEASGSKKGKKKTVATPKPSQSRGKRAKASAQHLTLDDDDLDNSAVTELSTPWHSSANEDESSEHAPSTLLRTASKRNAARRSMAAVRSHYFDNSGEDEE